MQPNDPRVAPPVGVPPRANLPPAAAPQPVSQAYDQPQQMQSPAPQPTQPLEPQALPAQPPQPQLQTPTEQALQPEQLEESQVQQPNQQYYDDQPGNMDDEQYYDDEDLDEVDDMTDAVNWQATEYIQRDKGTTWFIVFGIVMAVLVALAIFLMKSPTFALVLGTITAVIIVFAKRPPRLISYSLTAKGLYIGDTLHRFADFKSFGVIHDDDEFSVTLIPTKRFMPSVTVYFPEESGEAIVDMLGMRLPMRDIKLDTVDRVVRKLRL